MPTYYAHLFPFVYYVVCIMVFLLFNHGLSRQSKGQQIRRYAIGTIIAFAPVYIAGEPACKPYWVVPMLVSMGWIWSYNLLFHITNKAQMPDYDNHMDIAFAQYILCWLFSLHLLLPAFMPDWLAGSILAIIEIMLLLPIIFEWGHYFIYGIVPNISCISAMRGTGYNETIEFFKSFKLMNVAFFVIVPTVIIGLIFSWSVFITFSTGLSILQLAFLSAVCIFSGFYSWKKKHGLFVRTGIAVMWQDVTDYKRLTGKYSNGLAQRLSSLQVTAINTQAQPRTIVMVIGESACRDYMSVYKKQPWNTTPWQCEMEKGQKGNFIKFVHAYSCAMQTVPSLERALSESNLNNNTSFFDSCSIVDVAHKLGYKVHWYSNQGHLGVNDTAISLIAETADYVHWVEQQVGKAHYDMNLLDYVNEIDPEQNNLVVFHLKGSHFNYNNRYPKSHALQNSLTLDDDVQNYRISLHYTDNVLRQIHQTLSKHCNLDAMLYFSDHGAMPDTRRSPRFLGYGMVRIPMWLWCSDDFKQRHHETYSGLYANKDLYFTNDRIYELMCSVMDLVSNRFNSADSLASAEYRYTPDDLLTDEGRVRIADDPLLNE